MWSGRQRSSFLVCVLFVFRYAEALGAGLRIGIGLTESVDVVQKLLGECHLI